LDFIFAETDAKLIIMQTAANTNHSQNYPVNYFSLIELIRLGDGSVIHKVCLARPAAFLKRTGYY
jgi:hypothetical protein